MYFRELTILAGLCVPSALMAQDNVQIDATLRCNFEAECFEQQACSETDYSFDMPFYWNRRAADDVGGSGWGTATDVSGDRKMVILYEAGQMTASKIDMTSDTIIPPERFDLIVAANGAARLVVVQTTEPMLITYYGICSEAG